jgi:hypothetical protein
MFPGSAPGAHFPNNAAVNDKAMYSGCFFINDKTESAQLSRHGDEYVDFAGIDGYNWGSTKKLEQVEKL